MILIISSPSKNVTDGLHPSPSIYDVALETHAAFPKGPSPHQLNEDKHIYL